MWYAGVVKLADTQDLGSCAARRGGSSPSTRTIKGRVIWSGFELGLKQKAEMRIRVDRDKADKRARV